MGPDSPFIDSVRFFYAMICLTQAPHTFSGDSFGVNSSKPTKLFIRGETSTKWRRASITCSLGRPCWELFFSAMATRIFNISMPTVAATLGTDLLGISWALLAYQLSNIGLSIIFGRIADLWGR